MMKQFLEAQGLNYKEVNVQTDPIAAERLVQETGQMGVPQTKVNGYWILGFDPEKLMQYVKK
ncbi:glutaredoxin family protein [Salirhabdus sp. Marseille-P4669]|uniref:glutaredoxin family protein n=1 Tax=Salirhabdus sp. Marseille-P4669 TaxID=2042310 RepID=UPI000C7C9E98